MVDIPGRIHLDIFKLAQKNYKLESYGLSAVSANFIQGVIQSIQTVHCQYETLRLTDRVVVGESVPPNVHHAPFEPRYSPDGENVICFKGRLHTAPPAHRFCEAGTRAKVRVRYHFDTKTLEVKCGEDTVTETMATFVPSKLWAFTLRSGRKLKFNHCEDQGKAYRITLKHTTTMVPAAEIARTHTFWTFTTKEGTVYELQQLASRRQFRELNGAVITYSVNHVISPTLTNHRVR